MKKRKTTRIEKALFTLALDFADLDPGTQLKIFDRVLLEFQEIDSDDMENRAMQSMIDVVADNTTRALSENIKPNNRHRSINPNDHISQ